MKNKLIVVVDEDEHIRDVLQIILEDHGYSVISFNEVSLDLAGLFIPDLFVLDISLSNPINEDFYRFMKMNSYTASIPILLTSTGLDLEVKAAVWEAQACISKPFELDGFLETVDEILAGRPSTTAKT
jgi:DNA-binding response OmpR family regulator